MALAAKHTTRTLALVIVLAALALAITAAAGFFTVNQAQGSDHSDDSTLGLGVTSTKSAELTSAQRAAGTSNGAASVSEAVETTDSAQRSITVKDPDPVVVPVAVDNTNSLAVEKANQVCTLNPLPTAPHVAPDVNDGTWTTGTASAYCVATNDDGAGHFGVSTTASGIALTDSSITVAVPESKANLVGSVVEICYDGKVVIATVTDTGGFAKYGRDLDLAPGVYKALGFNSYGDWGLRQVSYRFL